MSLQLSRPLALSLLLLCALPAAATAQGAAGAAEPTSREQAGFLLQLQRRLLVLDLAGYDEARKREVEARGRVDDVAGRLDEALRGDSLTLGDLESLRDQLDAAREAARTAAVRVDEQVRNLTERLQSIGFLEGEVAGQTVRQAPADPLTGEWRVRIDPGNLQGVFVLRLSGSVVSGTYRIDGGGSGGSGSLRGTLTGTALRLERIDIRRGFDSIFEGTLTGDGQLSGLWTAVELAAGEPARGGWSAVRATRAGNEGDQ